MTETAPMTDQNDAAARRARAKRMTIVLALVALSFYVGFILMQVMGSRG